MGLGWGLIMCISKELPDEAAPAGLVGVSSQQYGDVFMAPQRAPRTTLGCRFELSTYVMATDIGMGGNHFLFPPPP